MASRSPEPVGSPGCESAGPPHPPPGAARRSPRLPTAPHDGVHNTAENPCSAVPRNYRAKRKGNFKQLPLNERSKCGPNLFLQEMHFYFHIFPKRHIILHISLRNLYVSLSFKKARNRVKENKPGTLDNCPRNLLLLPQEAGHRTPHWIMRSVFRVLLFCNFNI